MQGLSASRRLAQLALFPPPQSPADVDVHAVSIPARSYTGDFYYTNRYGERLWFALGDVAGKGINAAVVMAMIQEELEESIKGEPASAMARLHEFLRTVLPRNKFATAVIGYLDDDGILSIANAGHCPPLVVRRDGSVQEIGSTGPVTGILPSARWHSVNLTLQRGESLILYSDGLAEARKGEEEFGVRGIASAARGNTAREIGDNILDAARAYGREDDLTLVVLRR